MRFGSLTFVVAASVLSASGASAAPAPALPDTPAGRLGGELIRHFNTDTGEQLRRWATSAASSEMPADDQADFVKTLTAAARESGGVDLAAVRPGQRSGNLLLTVKSRRGGRYALVVVAADPSAPAKLLRAALRPAEDPALYADWPSGAVPPARMASLLHATLDRLARTSDFSGCVTVRTAAQTLFNECRGLADRDFAIPVDRETKFHIGSMDKMFTAVAIAQLVEAGKLSWTTTLAEAVPEYLDREAARKITVWQLLHHQAGLGDFFVPEFFQNREKFVNPADYLDLISRQPKIGEPGKQWVYSNAGFVLLGRIVENVSGEGYFDYVRHHVFEPAGMVSSGFDSQEDVTPKRAVGYFRDSPLTPVWKANWMTLPFKGSPAGGGYSTSTDLVRFAAALREGRLVESETLSRIFEDEAPVDGGMTDAAGFFEHLSSGRHIRGHGGGAPGMNADLAIVWETSAAVAVTSNEDAPIAQDLAERIADLLAAQGATPPKR